MKILFVGFLKKFKTPKMFGFTLEPVIFLFVFGWAAMNGAQVLLIWIISDDSHVKISFDMYIYRRSQYYRPKASFM